MQSAPRSDTTAGSGPAGDAAAMSDSSAMRAFGSKYTSDGAGNSADSRLTRHHRRPRATPAANRVRRAVNWRQLAAITTGSANSAASRSRVPVTSSGPRERVLPNVARWKEVLPPKTTLSKCVGPSNATAPKSDDPAKHAPVETESAVEDRLVERRPVAERHADQLRSIVEPRATEARPLPERHLVEAEALAEGALREVGPIFRRPTR